MPVNFSTAKHAATEPANMKPSDIEMNRQLYRYDSNWAFCRFDHPEIIGGRFGFGRGIMFPSDYGWPGQDPSASSTGLRIELLTTKGAYLYIEYEKYRDDQLEFDTGTFRHLLRDNGRDIINVQGFPDILWEMESEDGFVKVDFSVKPLKVLTLPDNILARTIFSMWLAVCRAQGTITVNGISAAVNGAFFLDHPRLTAARNDIKEFGSYLYTPIALDDGSYFMSYYSDFLDGSQNHGYCFGYYMDQSRNVSVYEGKSISDLCFTAENQVKRVNLVFENDSSTIELFIKGEEYPVLRTWGTGSIPRRKADNRVFPQPFAADFIMTGAGAKTNLTGKGITEYIKNEKRPFLIEP